MAKKKQLDATVQDAKIPYLRIILCLAVICTVCAALLGATYVLTSDPIAQNEAQAIDSILTELFGESAEFQLLSDLPENQDVQSVYLVSDENGQEAGYAIRVLTRGFSDDIDLIVGFDPQGAICGIEIVSLSETAGLGSLVGEDAHLNQYLGKSGQLTLKEDIDAISGATKSSKALIAGVNKATACFDALNAERGAQ